LTNSASSSRAYIEPFSRLVEQVMTAEPYASARTVYWIPQLALAA
jgi:hypothetical protein